MSRKPRWTEHEVSNGVARIGLFHWRWFPDYVNQELLDYTTYIYRGHANAEWLLEPTLDRVIKHPDEHRRSAHLQKFKYSVRGRRGANPSRIETENEWWALGQHHGLNTPLLDWTESPFVALFFAVVNSSESDGDRCCVWALGQSFLAKSEKKILATAGSEVSDGNKPFVEIVTPMSDENHRLVSQRGLFTRGPNNVDLVTWVEEQSVDDPDMMNLIKIEIPKKDLNNCLRYLNRMNTNYATLFPDLFGASHFCNTFLELAKY